MKIKINKINVFFAKALLTKSKYVHRKGFIKYFFSKVLVSKNTIESARLDEKIFKYLKIYDKNIIFEGQHKKKSQIFNNSNHSVDLYSKKYNFAIEIEKSEIKRIIHDIIKLTKAADLGLIKCGIIVYPYEYKTVRKNNGSVNNRNFHKTLTNDLNFYCKDIINNSKIKDIILVSYEYEPVK